MAIYGLSVDAWGFYQSKIGQVTVEFDYYPDSGEIEAIRVDGASLDELTEFETEWTEIRQWCKRHGELHWHEFDEKYHGEQPEE